MQRNFEKIQRLIKYTIFSWYREKKQINKQLFGLK